MRNEKDEERKKNKKKYAENSINVFIFIVKIKFTINV